MRAARAAAAAVVLALVAAGCLSRDDDPDPTSTPRPTATSDPNTAPAPPTDASRPGIRFLAIGDQGSGTSDQADVALAMQDVCAARGCDFVVALGDNIYEAGAADAYDEQFVTKFEDPYASFDIPFYMVQGNHDNNHDLALTALPPNPLSDAVIALGLGYWYTAGNVEVEYGARTDRVSEKWVMPARYYDFHAQNTSFFVIDSNTLMFYGIATPPVDVTYGQQEAWIDPVMAASDAPWKIVLAHHPYVSNGNHGNAGRYEENNPELPFGWEDVLPEGVPYPYSGAYVQEFYETHVCGKADVILTGHDHNLQWLMPVARCGATEFIVSGAASKTHGLPSPERNEVFFQQGDTLGFWWIEIVGDTFTGVAYDAGSNVLFERTMTKA
jgi:predicted phosphodiesterase